MGFTRYLQMAIAASSATTMVMAAPAPAPSQTTEFKDHGATCITGVPAVPMAEGVFPIIYYAAVKPVDIPENSYVLDGAWAKQHLLARYHQEKTSAGSTSPYTAMKCQYQCNAADGCVAYNVNDDYGCDFFDQLIDPSNLIRTGGNRTNDYGDYNKLCNPPPPIETHKPPQQD